MNIRFSLIGSNTVKSLVDSKCNSNFEIVNKVLFHSPITLCKEDFDLNEQNSKEIINLENILTNNKSDYAIVDLYALTNNLCDFDKNYYSERKQFLTSYSFKQCESVIHDFSDKCECDWRVGLDNYISLLKKHFDNNHIILINTFRHQFFLIDKKLRRSQHDNSKLNEWMHEVDSYFTEKCGCFSIDIFKNYFLDYQNLNGDAGLSYEKFAYKDIWGIIENIVYNHPEVKTYTHGSMNVRLERYVEYGDDLNRRFRAKIIFNEDDMLGNFLLSCSVDFIKKYYDEFQQIISCDYSDLNELLIKHNFTDIPEIKQAIICYQCTENGFLQSDVDFTIVFSYKFKLIKNISVYLQEFIDKLDISDIHVNIYNTEALFLLIYYHPNEPRLPQMIRSIYNSCAKVEKVDNWGSCISRECFNNAQNTDVEKYICRNSVLHAFEPPADIDRTIFDDNNNFEGSQWKRNNVYGEFYREAIPRLESSNSKWMVMDIYDITERTFMFNEIPFLMDLDTSLMGIFNRIKDKSSEYDIANKPFEWFKERLDKYIAFAIKKYGTKIIVINAIWKNIYSDCEGKLQSMGYETAEMHDKNMLLYKCQNYISEKTGCYVIDISSNFISDVRSPWGASPVHYESCFYQELSNIMEYIIQNSPDNRLYTEYSTSVRIDRIIRFRENNDGRPCLYEIFNDSFMDFLLLKMDIEKIKLYKDTIILIYKLKYKSYQDMIYTFDFKLHEAELLCQAFMDAHNSVKY